VPANSLLDRAIFGPRAPHVGSLQRYDDGRPIVVVSFAVNEPDRVREWILLRQYWLELPPHPFVLDAIDRAPDAALLLRYAAIHWRSPTPALDASQAARHVVATWGAQLTECLGHIWHNVADAQRYLFLRPLALIDLVNNLRVGFLPYAPGDPQLPPEVQGDSPSPDERALVYVIGATIFELCTNLELDGAEPIRSIVRRCVEPAPERRYQTLAALHDAWSAHALGNLSGDRATAWTHAEEGIGWLGLGDRHAALGSFRAALFLNPRLRVAKEGHDRLVDLLGAVNDGSRFRRARYEPPAITWAEAAMSGARLEADRDYMHALEAYYAVRLDGSHDADVHLAIARCQLALGASGYAIDYARRALTRDPHNSRAFEICCRGHLLAHRYADALAVATSWLAIAPSDASAHYLTGRALLRLGRTADARDAFDRAFELDPKMLVAMLLSHHVGRSMKRVSAKAGTPVAISIEIPAQLEHLREALLGGRVDEVIPILEESTYDNDPVVKLVHAECLAFAGRFEEALCVFDDVVSLSPAHRGKAAVGKIHALLALDRATDALAELDRVHDLNVIEVADLRASVLERIGLPADADVELGRVIADSEKRSNVRIGPR
jgi:tetratricopeptide (TPR) repeat protein